MAHWIQTEVWKNILVSYFWQISDLFITHFALKDIYICDSLKEENLFWNLKRTYSETI